MRARGSKAVENFSENTSVLVARKKIQETLFQSVSVCTRCVRAQYAKPPEQAATGCNLLFAGIKSRTILDSKVPSTIRDADSIAPYTAHTAHTAVTAYTTHTTHTACTAQTAYTAKSGSALATGLEWTRYQKKHLWG